MEWGILPRIKLPHVLRSFSDDKALGIMSVDSLFLSFTACERLKCFPSLVSSSSDHKCRCSQRPAPRGRERSPYPPGYCVHSTRCVLSSGPRSFMTVDQLQVNLCPEQDTVEQQLQHLDLSSTSRTMMTCFLSSQITTHSSIMNVHQLILHPLCLYHQLFHIDFLSSLCFLFF